MSVNEEEATSSGTGPSIEMPLRSWCWRADRL
jgi:hypothetical protein